MQICLIASIVLCCELNAQTWQKHDSLGFVCIENELYDSALIHYELAAKMVKDEFGETDTLYADRLNCLLYVNYYLGRYEAAIENGEKEKQIRLLKQGREHIHYGSSLNNLAYLYIDLHQYDKALPLCLESIDLIEMFYRDEYTEYGIRLNNLASLYQKMGHYDKALPLFTKALENSEILLGNNHYDYCIKLNNIAELYRIMGQYDKALPLYLESLEKLEKSQGRFHSDYVITLSNLGLLYLQINEFSKAQPLFEEALINTENIFGKKHAYYGIRLNNMAEFYRTTGQYDKALCLYIEALDNTAGSLGKNHPSYGVRLNNLGLLYFHLGNYELALEYIQQALRNCKASHGEKHPDYSISLINLANVYQKTGGFDTALILYREAIETDFHNINQAFGYLAESEKAEFIKTINTHFNNYITFFCEHTTIDSGIGADAFNLALATKGMILQSGIRMRQILQNSHDSLALHHYEKWVNLKATIARQYSLPFDKTVADLSCLEAEAEKLEGELTRLSAAFAHSQCLGNTTWLDVKRNLLENETAIEFVSYTKTVSGKNTDSIMYAAILILPKCNFPTIISLCEQRQLDSIFQIGKQNKNHINQTYRSITYPDENNTEYGQRLYELIWEPFVDLIPKNSTVYYSPSGSLHKIAFAAIPINNDTTLSNNYELIQLSSTAALTTTSKFNNKKTESIALFGGINYDTRSKTATPVNDNNQFRKELTEQILPSREERERLYWNYLPGTLQEINDIEIIAKNKNISIMKYTGSDAMEEQFKKIQGYQSPRIIHVATHGFFFDDINQGEHYNAAKNPLNRAGLLFAGANNAWKNETELKGFEDGILTASEASTLNLRNTQLVVLSACETGLGEVKGSEGVFGLQRAFKNAGVEYIIMSLWKVPDAETAEFMKHFYSELFTGKSIPEAFRTTQKYMKNLYYNDPFKWAAFVLVQ